jgi:hypothetical protein
MTDLTARRHKRRACRARFASRRVWSPTCRSRQLCRVLVSEAFGQVAGGYGLGTRHRSPDWAITVDDLALDGLDPWSFGVVAIGLRQMGSADSAC